MRKQILALLLTFLAVIAPLPAQQQNFPGNGTGAGGAAAGVTDTTLAPYNLTKAVIVSNGANFTITSGSANITCPTCTFTSTDAGKLFAASNWTGVDTNYPLSVGVIPAGTTILTVTDATHVVLSANASGNAGTTNTNNGIFAYGADGLAGLNAAIAAAWTGTVCQFIALPSYPFMLSAAPAGNASCPGTQGGSTLSHYAGIGGLAPYTATIIPAPGFTCALAQCFGGTNEQGVLWTNVSFNGLGQNINLTGKNFFATANDGQYDNLSFFGISASNLLTRTMTCVELNGGYHKFTVITIDGCGDMGPASAPATTAGLMVRAGQSGQTTYNLFVGNTGGTLISVAATGIIGLRDAAYIMSPSSTSGIGIDCAGTCSDFGGAFVFPASISSAVWQVRNGGVIDTDHVYYLNNGNTTSNVFSFAGSTSGRISVRNARLLQGGATGNVVGTVCAGCTFINDGGNLVSGTLMTNPPLLTCATAFCGVGNTVAVGLNSVEAGNVLITAAGTPAASGVITLTFNQTHSVIGGPVCTLKLSNNGASASWNARATVIEQTAAFTSYTWTVDNNAVALVAASTYAATWECIKR